MQHLRPYVTKAVLHLLVESHIGAPESIDRLLRIADQKELAADGSDSTPVCLARVIGGKQQEYFRLERIGVLELVHEEMAEAPLQLAANNGIVPDQIARLDEKIEEVEPSRLDLQGLVGRNRRPQGVMEKWSEIGVARLNEGVEINFGSVPKRARRAHELNQ